MVSALPIVWWVRRHSFASGRREFCLAICAMLCVGLLLFAPISISDDLHQDLFAAEDVNSAKKMVAGVPHGHTSSPSGSLPFAAVTALVGTIPPSAGYVVPSFTPVQNSSLLARIIPGRAPPAA